MRKILIKNKNHYGNIKYFLSLTGLIILFSFFGAHNVSAASVSFNAPASMNVGQNLDVVVNADTGGVMINSAEVVVDYDPNLLIFNGYSDENSVIKLWVNPPSAQAGQISLSGIIPGGVNGLYDPNKKGLNPFPLVHLSFTAKSAGTANFSFADSKILEDDGVGTALAHDNLPTSIIIKTNPSGTTIQAPLPTNIINPANSNPNPSAMPDRPDPLFWVVIFLLVSSILIYKLLKYKV